jgi:hypothetical protein
MAKQFSILMTNKDLDSLQRDLMSNYALIFIAEQLISDEQQLSTEFNLGIPKDVMGKVSLTCYLLSAKHEKHIAWNTTESSKKTIDELRSNVIQIVRPFSDANIMRAGRFFFDDRFVLNGQWIEKDTTFCGWASEIFKFVKKNLTKITHERVNYYVGKEANELIQSKKIRVVN